MGKGNTFVKRIERLDLQPNSFLILHCDPSLTHQNADIMLAKIKTLIQNRFPGLLFLAVPMGRIVNAELLDEDQLRELGWIRAPSGTDEEGGS